MNRAEICQLLTHKVNQLKDKEEMLNGLLPDIRLLYGTQPGTRTPVMYQPGIVFLFSGHKIGYINERTFRYDTNEYLLLTVPLPFECETFATPEVPLAGIDLSGLFALEPDVPLVVPDVNPFVLADYRNRNVIAVPNSLTSQLLSALKPLNDQGGLSRISVTNLLSASAHGKKAVDALAGQSAKLLNGVPIDEDDFFGRQLAFNMLPLLPDREGSVREERRIVDEVRKILQDDGLMISASVVQSPVFYGHAQMVSFEAQRPLTAEEARDALSRGEDIELSEEGEFPTQVGDASGNGRLSVGCVHNDYGMPEQVQFWSVADNVRFGGALMAVKIAEKLVQEYLY